MRMRAQIERTTRQRLGGAMAAALVLGGCATANRAVNGAATATASAATTVTSATSDLFMTIWPFPTTRGPERQREQMLEAAGPQRFRNEDFAKARYELRQPGSEFDSHRGKLVSEDFAGAKSHFRTGRTTPKDGYVLGPGASDPDVARALLLAAAAQGVPVLGVQPVLAQLLPAFGG